MPDSTVPTEHYISTVKALVKMIEQNDELRGELRDYEDAFEQLTKDAHNAENAASWLSTQKAEVFNPEEVLEALGRVVYVPSSVDGSYVELPIDKPLSYYEAQVVHHQLKLDEALRIVRNFKSTTVSDNTASSPDGDGTALKWSLEAEEEKLGRKLTGEEWENLLTSGEPIPYTIAEPDPDFSSTNPENFTYSLAEAAAILSRQGIDTGQNKLKKYLNEGICWTDAFGTPRGIAGDYLVETEPANPSRDAVVRITPEGVNELERVLNVAV